MREILFRGKRFDNEEWVFGNFIEDKWGDDNGNTIYAILQDRVAPDIAELWTPVRVIPETVGQFTGLYDNKGTRIFEGDIVSSNKRKTWIGMGEVWFGNSAFWCGEREWAKLLRVVCLEDEQAEVIGNIHDNPELLEAEE